ncbi:MAG TPA: AAA family ATPase [Candidatus Acidoferrales bacterium]|nr:AAA family ATPase [Candidatus Acidoferrales bacterium]
MQAATSHLLSGVRLRSDDSRSIRELRKLVESVDVPRGSYPAFEVHLAREVRGRLASRRMVLEAEWQDGPVVLRLRGFREPVVAASIPILQAGRGVEETCDCVIVRRRCAPLFLELIKRIRTQRDASYLHVFGSGHRRVGRFTWDDLVLSDSVVQLIRQDFETFLKRERWFRTHRLPFRRGYLFHGPPGNGKTSVIRAMLNGGKLDGHSIALFCEKTDDHYLERMFQIAAGNAPSLIVLEDIDRAFPQTPSQLAATKVSLPHLLNCLDGLGTQEGVVVVATANDPTTLDSAILRRPGRFDRVVEFPVPDCGLRATYFRKFIPHLTEAEVQNCVGQCEGFSFAQLREVYILAGQRAYDRGGEVSGPELNDAICSLRHGMAAVAKQEPAVGFSASSETGSVSAFLNRTEHGGER